MKVSGGCVAFLLLDLERTSLFTPGEHVAACLCNSAVCMLDLEWYDIGAGFWDDCGSDLLCEVVGE